MFLFYLQLPQNVCGLCDAIAGKMQIQRAGYLLYRALVKLVIYPNNIIICVTYKLCMKIDHLRFSSWISSPSCVEYSGTVYEGKSLTTSLAVIIFILGFIISISTINISTCLNN